MVFRSLSRAVHDVKDDAAAPTLEQLFIRHADDVRRIVARILGPSAANADVDDLTQQVFLKVHAALPKFRGASKVTTWLHGIAYRTVLHHLRSRRRRARLLDALDAGQLENVSASDLEQRLIDREELQRVWRCLLHIEPKKRIVFLMFEMEGLSGKQIAEALEIREATVWTRLHHARRELLASLAEEDA